MTNRDSCCCSFYCYGLMKGKGKDTDTKCLINHPILDTVFIIGNVHWKWSVTWGTKCPKCSKFDFHYLSQCKI